jgi:hypothetical protein
MMAFSYILTDDIGKVRLLVPDSNEEDHIFEDDEISTFLVLENGIKRATALALETIASNEALVLKVMTLLDLTTDGAKVSDALLKRADKLRSQAQEEEDLAVGDSFAVVEWIVDPFTARQAIVHDAYRGLY